MTTSIKRAITGVVLAGAVSIFGLALASSNPSTASALTSTCTGTVPASSGSQSTGAAPTSGTPVGTGTVGTTGTTGITGTTGTPGSPLINVNAPVGRADSGATAAGRPPVTGSLVNANAPVQAPGNSGTTGSTGSTGSTSRPGSPLVNANAPVGLADSGTTASGSPPVTGSLVNANAPVQALGNSGISGTPGSTLVNAFAPIALADTGVVPLI